MQKQHVTEAQFMAASLAYHASENGLPIEGIALNDDGLCTIVMTGEEYDHEQLKQLCRDLQEVEGVDTVGVLWPKDGDQMIEDDETFGVTFH